MALNTSFFYFIILWKGHADVMVDGPLGRGSLVAGGWWLVVRGSQAVLMWRTANGGLIKYLQ